MESLPKEKFFEDLSASIMLSFFLHKEHINLRDSVELPFIFTSS
jgi:hypothetical protein